MRFLARALVLIAALMTFAAAARADGTQDAERLFEEGKQLMAAGDYPAACSKLAASLRLDPGIGTMLWLADCFEQNGQHASAWQQYRDAAAAAAQAGDEREKVARAKAAGIEPTLSKLVIVVERPARGLVIDRDGIEIPRSLWGVEVPVDPGKHTIAAKAPGRTHWQTWVDVGQSPTASVTVPELTAPAEEHPTQPKIAPAPAPAPASDRTTGQTQRSIGLVVGGVGLVAIGVGTYFGLHAKSLNDKASERCPAVGCDDQGYADRSDAKASARWSTLFFAAGAVAVGSGAVLYFTAPKAAHEVAVAPVIAPAGAGLNVRTNF